MRQFFCKKYAYCMAAMLAGVVSFSSCSNDDELIDNGPAQSGEVVKTQFAINVPYAGGSNTRMSGTTVQETGFRGISDIRLIPLTQTGADNVPFSTIIRSLDDITNGSLSTSASSKVYSDVSIQTGTTNFLFYGVAPSNSGNHIDGVLTSSLDVAGTVNTDDITFSLNEITTQNAFEAPQTALLAQLNAVKDAAGWSTYTAQQTTSGVNLEALYGEYTKSDVRRGGSAEAIRLQLERLYNTVNGYATATDETSEKAIASAIQTAITGDAGLFSPTAGDNGYTLAYKNTNTYPTDLGMPEGAAQVEFVTAEGKFQYVNDPTVGSANVVNMYNICYPASLFYFVSTPLKASDLDNVTWPKTTTDWTAANGAGGTWNGWDTSVSGTTRSIALVNNIQYGVARLDTKVRCKTASLEDNAQGVLGPSVDNNFITVPQGGFNVTGVLVGGQPASAGWDFEPAENATMDKVIYDRDLQTIKAPAGSYGSINHTLVLDNASSNATKTVRIALELENNSGVDFYGVDGVVANNAKFYLVAELNPQASTGVGQPTEDDGDPNTPLSEVFKQDYTTTANLTISSLKNAYVTIPDLRAPQLELGLSVDLSWQTGISFDVTIE